MFLWGNLHALDSQSVFYTNRYKTNKRSVKSRLTAMLAFKKSAKELEIMSGQNDYLEAEICV